MGRWGLIDGWLIRWWFILRRLIGSVDRLLDRFIQGMMSAGAANYMDCVGIHYNAGATPPSATSGHPSDSTGHYSYYYLPMIDLYYDTFNASGGS